MVWTAENALRSADLYKTTTEERGAEEKILFSWKKPKVTNQALKKINWTKRFYFRNETQLQHSAPWSSNSLT